MPAERAPTKIGVDEIIEAAGQGALRALEARGVSMATLPRSGVFFQVKIICGLPPYLDQELVASAARQSAAAAAGPGMP